MISIFAYNSNYRLSLVCVYVAIIFLFGFHTNAAHARTITLDDTNVNLMAHISPEVSNASWIGRQFSPGMFLADTLEMVPGRHFLIQYPLDTIPAGQQITSAQWIIPVDYVPRGAQRMFLWRMLAKWGFGVNNNVRTTIPKPTPWSTPGGNGPGTDRSLKPSAIVRIDAAGELTIDVTTDVSLWYNGLAPNCGWMISIDEGDVYFRMPSPLYQGRNRFKLRITYEPQ